MILVSRQVDLRSPCEQFPAFRMGLPAGKLLDLPDVYALNESRIGMEAFIAIDVLKATDVFV
jgi:hypothetical protein